MVLTANVAARMMMPISASSDPAPPLRRWPRSTAGFTLLELLLVLSLIGLVSMLLYPPVGNLEARSFSARVRQAAALLNHARRDAVVRGQPGTVRLLAGTTEAEAAATAPPRLLASWESGAIQLRFQDSTEQLAEIADSIDITFFPEGGSTGGTLLLVREDRQARIVIDPFTGRISHDIAENR